MKIKCDNCEIEDKGNIKKLIKKGWKFYFFKEKGLKVSMCKECKPHFKDKIKKFFDENHKTEMEKQIGIKINKIKTLYALKDKMEKTEEKNKMIKGSKHSEISKKKLRISGLNRVPWNKNKGGYSTKRK